MHATFGFLLLLVLPFIHYTITASAFVVDVADVRSKSKSNHHKNNHNHVSKTQRIGVSTSTSASYSTTPILFLFGKGLADAFKNDDRLGARPNEGLAKGPNYNPSVTINGAPIANAVVGQKLTTVASLARVRIPVDCQQGTCGTCTVQLNGRKVKACQVSLPAGKATIQTL